jgi:ribosomal protein S21
MGGVKDAARVVHVPTSLEFRRMQVLVRDNNVEQALRVLKKKLQREGVFREMKRAAFYENLRRKRLAKSPKPFVALASWLENKPFVKD